MKPERKIHPMPSGSRSPVICLAASGGGHVRQLLDLRNAWAGSDYFFVTEDTALGRSLAREHPVEFVTHYALGQARLGHPFRMIAGAIRNLFQSLAIVLRRRPDIVITTGAGAVFWVALFARISGARLVMIESFARFDRPSKFARLTAPFATHKVVQARPLLAWWPDAALFDPLRIDGTATDRRRKEALLFATVGATLPFPRLVDAIARLKASGMLPERVIVQYGDGAPPPAIPGLEARRDIPFDEIQSLLEKADIVLCHGGTGSLITALRAGCRVIAMPRRFDLGEHYDNHQEEITSAFAIRGLIESLRDEQELGAAITRARAREPVVATTDHSALVTHLQELMSEKPVR